MDICFACIATVLKIIAADHTNIKIVVCMHEIHVFHTIEICGLLIVYIVSKGRNRQHASGYLDCRVFPVLYILLVHCHQYQIHCSMTILHTYSVWYSYIIVGVGHYTESEEEY